MQRILSWRNLWRGLLIALPILGVAFALYLTVLYRQLEQAFRTQEESLPTRIYSDLTRLAAPLPKRTVLRRLHALGYAPPTESGDSLTFVLRAREYPERLIPLNHPTYQAQGKPVRLEFDGTDPEALLRSVHLADGTEVPEIFLEPEPVATLSRGGDKREIRKLVKIDKIPQSIKAAVMAVEDQHFLDHNGLDPRGLARAIWVNLKTLSFSQGGSTITQQLVKNLMARRSKNLFRKANELFLALILEARWSKNEIMERYLNEVYLGQVGSLEVHGVVEGARLFFGKSLEQMNLAEAALMAAMIRGPFYYSPYRHWDRAIERQRWVLKRMMETGQIAREEEQEASRASIRLEPPQTSANKAPWYVDYVKNELVRTLADRFTEEEVFAKGLHVYTTLDMEVAEAAQRAVTEGVERVEKGAKLAPGERLEGALAAVDQTTGFVRALVGGRSYSQSGFNRILNMRRQVGSTFKPFVYLAAFEKGQDSRGVVFTPAYPLEDAPWKLTYDSGRQTWNPKNYEKGHLGWIGLRTALANSVNTVAAKLGVEVGLPAIVQTARALGIESQLPEVPSLSLGVAELSPVELLKSYAIIANHGEQDTLTVIRLIAENNGGTLKLWVAEPQQRVSQGAADLTADMLTNVFTEGTARDAVKLGFDRPAAGKTGTTSHHRDAWFAGFTPQLTAVVWVGQDQPSSQSKVKLTGAGSALPIWTRFMKDALAGNPVEPFPISSHLTEVRLDRHSGKRASSDCPTEQTVLEKVIAGKEPEDTACDPTPPPTEKEKSI